MRGKQIETREIFTSSLGLLLILAMLLAATGGGNENPVSKQSPAAGEQLKTDRNPAQLPAR